jgi:hypothetical protein
MTKTTHSESTFTELEDRRMFRAFTELRRERIAQQKKWGEQNHPDGTGEDLWKHRAQNAKEMTDLAAKTGALTYMDILFEEVAEAFAESDKAKLRVELVQVAAVALAWLEKLERETGTEPRCESVSPICGHRCALPAEHDGDHGHGDDEVDERHQDDEGERGGVEVNFLRVTLPSSASPNDVGRAIGSAITDVLKAKADEREPN